MSECEDCGQEVAVLWQCEGCDAFICTDCASEGRGFCVECFKGDEWADAYWMGDE